MGNGRTRVYCAGPLFNEKEREEMQQIAGRLEACGFDTFLPQRDGLELTTCVDELVRQGFTPDRANRLMGQAIFALDVHQVLHVCDLLVANLNGRVPDEGTVSEAAMAWSRGVPVIGYKADSRSVFASQDNPLVAGLFGFRLCQSIDEIEQAVRTATDALDRRVAPADDFVGPGSEIWSALQRSRAVADVIDVIVKHESDMIGEPAG